MGQLLNSRKKKFFKRRLIRKQGGVCWYCRSVLNLATATLDHVIPRSLGGPDSPRNLVAACHSCNQKKRDSVLKEKIPMKTKDMLLDIAVTRGIVTPEAR